MNIFQAELEAQKERLAEAEDLLCALKADEKALQLKIQEAANEVRKACILVELVKDELKRQGNL